MIALLAMTVALVADDATKLLAAPRETSQNQAMLARGDWLEIRGEVPGYFQVYDHRRERPGYVKPGQLRAYPVEAQSAPALRAVVDFLRDAPGYESLGIGAAALLLRCDPAFDTPSLQLAIGTMAERLARKPHAGHRDVAESYGVKLVSQELQGEVRTCYDGAAFRTVLAMSKVAEEQQRAALALTERCLEPQPGKEPQWLEWRLSVLEKPALSDSRLSMLIRLRRAETLARLAFRDPSLAAKAVDEFAAADAAPLAEDDAVYRNEVRARVASVRWNSQAPMPKGFELAPGKPGETCLRKRCTYGHLFAGSLQQRGSTFAISVQPLESWTELWVFHNGRFTVLPPSTSLGAGSAEALGISPDSRRVLVLRTTARGQRYEERRTSDLRLLRSASSPIGHYADPARLASLLQ